MIFSFPIEEYTNLEDRVCMHCKTEEEANIFLGFLHSLGKTWCDGTSYLDRNNFDDYRRNTCYYFNDGTYCSTEWAVTENTKILEFSDWIVQEEELECDNTVLNDFLSTIEIHK